MQRVRVGMTGLASVFVLIALASAVFNSANREPPASAVGASKPAVVANLTDTAVDNTAAPNEPLAEIGVAPSTDTNVTQATN